MTGPREWPTNAAEDRDAAAEHINDAAVIVEKVIPRLPQPNQKEMLEASLKLQKALRLLERQGAKSTLPARRKYQPTTM